MIRSFDELFSVLKSRHKKMTVAVPMGQDPAALQAVIDANREGIAAGLFIGPKEEILEGIKKEGADPSDFEIVDVTDPSEAAAAAVSAVREGRADMILKGHVDTPVLMKAVLDADKGLRTGKLISDVFIYENKLSPTGKLVGLTDGGINIAPDLQQKKEIIENAVEVFHRLGVATPKVACMSAVEKVTKKMQSTLDAAELKAMNKRGEIKGCIVDGPFAVDNALDRRCAEIKGINSEVAGDPDILLAPNIEAGNMFAKAVVFYGGITPGHAMVGCKAPVLINSRVDTREAKLNSIALGAICCEE